jgi:hypothetical protein
VRRLGVLRSGGELETAGLGGGGLGFVALGLFVFGGDLDVVWGVHGDARSDTARHLETLVVNLRESACFFRALAFGA